MGVGLAIVMETKIKDARYTCLASGYKILASRAASHNQGGIALLWKEDHQGFEVDCDGNEDKGCSLYLPRVGI
jgi:hypothetical protein